MPFIINLEMHCCRRSQSEEALKEEVDTHMVVGGLTGSCLGQAEW